MNLYGNRNSIKYHEYSNMISVIIPTYKPEQSYFMSCIDSVMNQSLKSDVYEVIIVLNGPQHPYYEEIKKYIKKRPNVSLYYSSTPGVSNARNIGISKSIGDYICFIDDDDVVSFSYLEKLLEISNEYTIGISNVNSFVHSPFEKGKDFFICNQLENKEKYINKPLVQWRSFLSIPTGKMLHKNIIAEHRFDIRFTNGEDALFITSITDNVSKLCFTSEDAVYYVRLRKDSASRKKIPFSKIVKDSLLLLGAYITIYFQNSRKYNLALFLSRIPGVLKNAYILLRN